MCVCDVWVCVVMGVGSEEIDKSTPPLHYAHHVDLSERELCVDFIFILPLARGRAPDHYNNSSRVVFSC